MNTFVSEPKLEDRKRWRELWAGYLAFYERSLPEETYERTWQRVIRKSGTLRCLCLWNAESRHMVGIVHFLLHESAWTDRTICYLQDLFVDPVHRGQGHGRRLIEAVAGEAVKLDCERMYWLTQEHNVTARQLYDRVAKYEGFIRYDYELRRDLAL